MGGFALFNEHFFILLFNIAELSHPSYICGDFNINQLTINVKAHYNNFFENTLSSGLFPKITLPLKYPRLVVHVSSLIIF